MGIAIGAFVTFGLFLLMQALIKSDKSPFTDPPYGSLLDFVRLQEEQEIDIKKRKPKPPPRQSMSPLSRRRNRRRSHLR